MPDEAVLARWMDDELSGAELAAVERWAQGHPEQLAAREASRSWRQMASRVLPAAEEPPYAEFFNARVLHAIRHAEPSQASVLNPSRSSRKRHWWMPVSACAGMAASFWVGAWSAKEPEIDVTGAPRAIPVEPALYTPEKGVEAEWFASKDASATVIVLRGVAAIPDATDFSETAFVPEPRESDHTAEAIHPTPASATP